MAYFGSISNANTTGSTTGITLNLATLGAPAGAIILLEAIADITTGTFTITGATFSTVGSFTNMNLTGGEGTVTLMAPQYLVATGSEGTITIKVASSSHFYSVTARAYTGRGTANPFVVTPVQTGPVAQATGPITFSLTGLTANAGDDIVQFLGGGQASSTSDTFSFAQSSGFGNKVIEQAAATSFAPIQESADNTNVSAGATGTLTGTLNNTSGVQFGYGGYVISLAAHASSSGDIVQQTQLYSPAASVTCPTFGSAVTAGDAIIAVGYMYPVALAASNSPSIGDGTANVYQRIGFVANTAGTNVYSITFTAPPTGTSATLTANWAGSTDSSNTTIFFSDGEIRKASVTNGSAAISWTTALTGSPTVSAQTYFSPGLAVWYVPNSVAGTVTPAFTGSLAFGINALYAAEITNVGAGSTVLGLSQNVQFGPGASTNAINSGSVTINQAAVLFGFCADISGLVAPGGPTGGTGFTAQPPVWNTGTYNMAIAEAATVNTSTAATFTAGHGADTFYTFAMALAGPGPFTPFTQTQFFVIDTIIQQ